VRLGFAGPERDDPALVSLYLPSSSFWYILKPVTEKNTNLPTIVPSGDSSSVVEPPNYAQPPVIFWKYSRAFAERVCDYLMNGKSLTKICKLQGMPSYSTICYWRANNVDFDNMLKKAKQFRAEQFRDLIEDSLAEAIDKDDIPAAKLAFDKLKYLASVDDPDTFGKKTNNGGGDTNIQVVIDTGIRRE
jgi:hypothetical protein